MQMRKLLLTLVLVAFQFGPLFEAANATEPAATPTAGGYQVINAGGPGCIKPSPEEQKLFDQYRAFHYCFTYKFAAEASFGSEITNAVYAVMKILIPITNFIELYQPNKNTIRFQVKDNKNYRVYKYWAHNLANIPPPGEYTDHKFVNEQLRSVDYYLKLKQRGTGKNARISGVAEVVFVPDELYENAKQDGFLK